jgi:Protein of unknown function (DUF982)
MENKPWSKPVAFEAHPGTCRVVASTDEASHYLLNRWPVEGGEHYIEARKVCLDVLAGLRTPEDARAAFLAATAEAGMAVIDADKPADEGAG